MITVADVRVTGRGRDKSVVVEILTSDGVTISVSAVGGGDLIEIGTSHPDRLTQVVVNQGGAANEAGITAELGKFRRR